MRLLLLLCLGLALAAKPLVFTVYQGSLGTQAVLAELAQAPGGRVLGRYCYLKRGVDLFLEGRRTGQVLRLEEPRLGREDEEGKRPVSSTGAWRLEPKDRGLEGTWSRKAGAPALKLLLREVGRYQVELDPGEGWMEALGQEVAGSIRPGKAAYAHRKMAVAFREEKAVEAGAVAWRMVRDPYLGLAYPRLLRHPDPAVLRWLNDALEQAHWARVLEGLHGRASDAYSQEPWAGSDGGYSEGTEVTVTLASPSLFCLTESGSLFFGGAHPYNHWNPVAYDLLRRCPLDFNRLLSLRKGEGFTPAFERRFARILEAEKKGEASCAEYLPQYLGLQFSEEGLVLGITGIFHAMGCCLGQVDLIPYRELGPHLRPGVAGQYFPERRDLGR